jgi:hypothetical protein
MGEVGVRLADEEYMQLQLNYSLPDANPIPPTTQVSLLSLHFPNWFLNSFVSHVTL